jgi:hypothetical protein
LYELKSWECTPGQSGIRSFSFSPPPTTRSSDLQDLSSQVGLQEGYSISGAGAGRITSKAKVASADENKKPHEEMPKPHEHLGFLITAPIDLSARHKDCKA